MSCGWLHAGETGVCSAGGKSVAPTVMIRLFLFWCRWFGGGVCLVGDCFRDVSGLVVSGSFGGECTFAFDVCLCEVAFEVGEGAIGCWLVTPFSNIVGEESGVLEVL